MKEMCSKLSERVAPFAGAWIEISPSAADGRGGPVAPFAGAWIEMISSACVSVGLVVAPFAGAWIEIRIPHGPARPYRRRSLRGSVD